MKVSLAQLAPLVLPDAKAIIKDKGAALRRVAARIRSRAYRAFRTKKPFGYYVFGAGYGKPTSVGKQKQMTIGKLVDKGGELSVDLAAKGLAYLQETGTPTKGHWIKTRNGLPLGKAIWHPGGRVRKDPSLEPEINAGMSEIEHEVAAALAKHGW